MISMKLHFFLSSGGTGWGGGVRTSWSYTVILLLYNVKYCFTDNENEKKLPCNDICIIYNITDIISKYWKIFVVIRIL